MKTSQVIRALETIAPARIAASWDNSGWQIRHEDTNVTGMLLTIDVTAGVLDEAAEAQANLIVSHHPLIFDPLKRLDLHFANARVIAKAIKDGVSVFSMHSNLDVSPHSPSIALAELLGLVKVRFLDPLPLRAPFDVGWGAVGKLDHSISVSDLRDLIVESLQTELVRVITADMSQTFRSVAIGAGSLSNLIPNVLEQSVTVYITSDVKYHDAQYAVNNGLTILDVDHYYAERPVLDKLRQALEPQLDIPVTVSRIPTSPPQYR